MPSAMVWPPSGAAFSPRILAVKEGYIAASTPTTLTSALIDLAAVATPEMSPPPPIGTISVSSSGVSSSISTATVPCPAITSRSSNGCTRTSPRS